MTRPSPGPEPDRPLAPLRVTGPVLAGVIPRQPGVVLHRAAELAFSMGVELICAYVDVSSYQVRDDGEGHVETMPIDPDGVDDDPDSVFVGLKNRLAVQLAPYVGISWSLVTLAGDPSRALGRLAESVNASLIVVGTREHGIGARLEDLLVGSVAVHLTHRQHRPVLVVPLNPRTAGAEA